jgi:hypothetical protein
MQRLAGSDAREAGRTAQDACATLVELARALKGWLFYEPESPARQDLLDRTFRVFRSEVGRGGPLALEVRRGAFWLAGTDVAVGMGRLDELARRLYERAIGRIVFDAELEAPALAAFLDVLVEPPEAVAGAGGFEARFFTEPHRGIRLNDTDWRSLLVRATAAAAASSLDTTLPAFPEPDEPEVLAFVDETEDADARADAALDLLDDLAPDVTAPAAAQPPPTHPLTELEPEHEAVPAAEPEPASVAEPPPADAFGELLRDLEDCDDDRLYRDAIRDLVFEAQSRLEQGHLDDCYRALQTLAAHAGDDAKRSVAQRDSAREAIAQLADTAVIGDLVKRACSADADASIAAIGVLREVGAAAVPRLLEGIDAGESERRAQLASVVIAMGEEAVPALAHAITSGSAQRQRSAVRLAGETQNPRIVPNLRDALLGATDDVAREAAHALARIGDVSSLEALAEALECPRAAVVSFAASALGATGRALAVGPLAAALDRALDAGQLGVAREAVRGLGRLARPESVPTLAGLLARGGLLRRAKLRDLKLAAVAALANIQGRAAEDALARAARGSDGAVRQAALVAQKRRARAIKALA